MKLATELDIPDSEVNAINESNPQICLASFKILMSWYDQQVYKTEAYVKLRLALKEAGLAGIIEKCLGVTHNSEG